MVLNTVNLTDEQLIALIREKDQELYSEIIHRYETKLSHYLRKFVHDPDEIEDVLQDVFIKTFRNLNNFNVQKRFSPLIYRIAHNEAINFIKKYSKEVISIEQSEWDVIDRDLGIDKKIDQNIVRQKIAVGLSMMKDKYREPLIFYFFEDKTYEEISDILQIPVSTVGVLLSRGKKMLNETLDKNKLI